MSKPKFLHDCNGCHFLGHHEGHDLYFCAQSGLGLSPTVVARSGDEGSDYTSGLELAKFDSRLAKAKSLAIAAGYLVSA